MKKLTVFFAALALSAVMPVMAQDDSSSGDYEKSYEERIEYPSEGTPEEVCLNEGKNLGLEGNELEEFLHECMEAGGGEGED